MGDFIYSGWWNAIGGGLFTIIILLCLYGLFLVDYGREEE